MAKYFNQQTMKTFTHRLDGHDGPWQAVASHSLCHNAREQTENINEAKDDTIGGQKMFHEICAGYA